MKTNKILLFFAVILLAYSASSQDRLFTKNGQIRFYSKAPMETIEAINKSTTCVLDTKTGALQFLVLMKGFEFKKALMQEHFNENYVESNKFPKSEFKGRLVNAGEINYSKEGSYQAKVKGNLSIHGETKEVETMGTITVSNGKVTANAVFTILLSDYKISIPSLVKDKVSNSVKITVSCPLAVLNNQTNN